MTTTTPTVVDRFLDAVATGAGLEAELYAPDATLDATVPGWRFRVRGDQAVAAEYGKWFADPASFEELDRRPIAGGEVLTYTLAWQQDGVPHAAHHCHRIELTADGTHIAADTVFCGGRWDAALLAQMAESDR
jgi:hypothetical protein